MWAIAWVVKGCRIKRIKGIYGWFASFIEGSIYRKRILGKGYLFSGVERVTWCGRVIQGYPHAGVIYQSIMWCDVMELSSAGRYCRKKVTEGGFARCRFM